MATTTVKTETDRVRIGIDDAVTMEGLAFGEVGKKFPEALKAVAANIADFGTSVKVKREITVRLTFEPEDDRKSFDVQVDVTTKLAPPKPAKTKLYLQTAGNELVVTESNPEQPDLVFGK